VSIAERIWKRRERQKFEKGGARTSLYSSLTKRILDLRKRRDGVVEALKGKGDKVGGRMPAGDSRESDVAMLKKTRCKERGLELE